MDKKHVIVPLWFRMSPDYSHVALTLDPDQEPGAILVTKDNADLLFDLMELLGAPELHIYATTSEAVAAGQMISRFGRDHEVYVGKLSGGEGLLLVLSGDPLRKGEINLEDHRPKDQILWAKAAGSWTLSDEEIAKAGLAARS